MCVRFVPLVGMRIECNDILALEFDALYYFVQCKTINSQKHLHVLMPRLRLFFLPFLLFALFFNTTERMELSQAFFAFAREYENYIVCVYVLKGPICTKPILAISEHKHIYRAYCLSKNLRI